MHAPLSRRALLASLSTTAATVAAGCISLTNPGSRPSDGQQPSNARSEQAEISLPAEAAWTTYGFGSGHTGHNPNAVGVGETPSQVWESRVDGIYTLREPAVADGRLFVGSATSMWAFDATTGESEWTRDLDSMPHQYPPTYRDDTLYAVSKETSGVNNPASGTVWALAPDNGYTRWRTDLPVTSTVAHDEERLYVAALADERGFVQALHADDGERAWRFDVPDASRSYVTGTPAYTDDTLFVTATHVADDGSRTGALYALAPSDGSIEWQATIDEAATLTPVIADSTVFVTGRSGTVRAFTTAGDSKWSRQAGADVYTRPTYADGRLFVLTAGDIVAFDDAGTELWRAGNERTQTSGMTVAGDTLYVGGEPLLALNVNDGSIRFEIAEGAFHGSYGPPIAVDDVLYAGICIKREPSSKYDNYVRAFV